LSEVFYQEFFFCRLVAFADLSQHPADRRLVCQVMFVAQKEFGNSTGIIHQNTIESKYHKFEVLESEFLSYIYRINLQNLYFLTSYQKRDKI